MSGSVIPSNTGPGFRCTSPSARFLNLRWAAEPIGRILHGIGISVSSFARFMRIMFNGATRNAKYPSTHNASIRPPEKLLRNHPEYLTLAGSGTAGLAGTRITFFGAGSKWCI